LSEDDQPLAKKKVNGRTSASKEIRDYSDDDDVSESASESESDEPLAKKKPAAKPRSSNAKAQAKKSAATSSSEDEKPLAKRAKAAPKKAVKKEYSSSEEDEKPLAKKAKASSSKVKEEKKPVVKKEKKVKEEEQEEQFKWWEQAEGDGTVKWTTLVHNAVLFPPPYVPLPKDVKMKYDGVPLTLPPESEEVAGFFGAMLGTDHVEDKVFQANFFRDFKAMLEQYPPVGRN
jgi:DNA topoisomerase-1